MAPPSDKPSIAVLAAASGNVDPSLAALFVSSAGPVGIPKARVWASNDRLLGNVASGVDIEEGNPEQGEPGPRPGKPTDASTSQWGLAAVASDPDGLATPHDSTRLSIGKSRKRRRRLSDDNEELESRYLGRILEEPLSKRKRLGISFPGHPQLHADSPASEESSSDMPIHESLSIGANEVESGKAACTVFLSNVSIEAITSRSAKKTLLAHLSSVLDESASPSQSLVSLRFRSVPFSTAKIPKKAAFITKSIMDATTKSTNAYVVYSNVSAASRAVSQLNGSIVLDRHLRADSVAQPAPVDHHRCIFVGNLGFVDDEVIHDPKPKQAGEHVTDRRKKTRAPMDVEEGLWRTFGKHAGKVESVRVVREEATRVGKGIAYVQFYDGTSVEAALLLSGKKFPPLLPRELRISRCRAPHRTARAMERSGHGKTGVAGPPAKHTKGGAALAAGRKSFAGQRALVPGQPVTRSVVTQSNGNNTGNARIHPPAGSSHHIVFEGHRARARDGKPTGLKARDATRGKKIRKDMSNNKKRQARRAASWRVKQKSS